MTPLRLQMIEDMRSAGLAPGTQAVYVDAVRRLAEHYRRSPTQLTEDEVRSYLLGLRERGLALGTFKTNHGGIQFLYRSHPQALPSRPSPSENSIARAQQPTPTDVQSNQVFASASRRKNS